MNVSGTKQTCLSSDALQSYLDQQMKLPDRVALERHLRDCPTCREKLAHFQELFQQLEENGRPDAGDLLRPDQLGALMGRLGTGVPHGVKGMPSGSLSQMIRTLFAALGSSKLALASVVGVVVLVALTVLRLGSQAHSPVTPLAVSGMSYALAPGGTSLIEESNNHRSPVSGPKTLSVDVVYRLPDQGRIEVANAELEAFFSFDRRASFQVTPRGVTLFAGRIRCDIGTAGRGFEVKTPRGTVSTHGTLFEVESTASHTRVLLRRGVILLQTPQTALLLESPGERFLTDRGLITEQVISEPLPKVAVPPIQEGPDRPSSVGADPTSTTNPAASGLSQGY